MSTNNVNNNILKPSTRTRRAAAMLCAVLAGLGLARGAAAQQPQALSPGSPTPYQSPLFHSGGSDPGLSLTPPPFGLTDPGPPNPLLLNPLYGQLQGTPTALVPGTGANAGSLFSVQIPSFVLGAYNPASAPGQGTSGVYVPTGVSTPTAYYRSHLADGGIFSWTAPFDYVPLATGLVTVDDTAPAPTAAVGATPGTSGFVLTPAGNWQQQTTGPAAGTATGGEYYRLPPDTSGTTNYGTATWTLVATAAGGYSIYYHIPDQIEDGSSPPIVEPRSTQVTYQITTTGANAMTTTATVSQTEANSSQFLAGPFLLAAGDTVTVTLQRDNRHNQNTQVPIPPATTGAYLIADSMTMQTAIGDVRSSPTAINTSAYPNDFKLLKYWGIYIPATTTNPVPATTTAGANNALPDTSNTTGTGTPIYRYGDATKADPIHLIRQLVYFGRQEPTFSNGSTVDDRDNPPTATAPGFSTTGFGPPTPDATGTATNLEYRKVAPVSAGAGPTATWTFIAPNGGDFYATVHLPETPPVPPGPAQKRITDAPYTVTVNGAVLATQPVGGFKISQAQTGDVTLPTGALALNKGDVVTVTLTAVTALTNPTSYTVVADSVRIATGGTGAIYCVDGFSGGIVWRFQTPGGLNGPGAPVFSSPVVTKINVMTKPATAAGPAIYQNKLVVIVGDENGMVYCLDAIGNGDGTSNSNAIDPVSGLPIYIPQPTYQSAAQPQVDAAGYVPHVGTTGAYWIYRPDPNKPKYVTGGSIGKVKPASQFDVNSDLPVPAAFGTASPNVFIDPAVSRTPDPTTGSIPLNANGSAPSNAKVYVGNSNGVLYALDAVGIAIDGTSAMTFDQSGDRFNASYDLRRTTTELPVPTPQPLWWFSLRGADPNSTDNPSNADIESAPAIHLTATAVSVVGPPPVTTYTYAPTVYIGSAHEVESTSNVGRLYALDGTYGPAGSNGQTFPTTQPDPTQANYTGPGSAGYNVGQRPQISATDVADWSFPDAYDRSTGITKNNQGQSSNKLPRPALGNVTGSPVVFTDTNETNTLRQTRIFFAANVGLEVPTGSTVGTAASPRPDDTETGRVWAVNLDGSVGRTTRSSTSTAATTVWAYPLANDPNDATLDKTPEPSQPLGSFLRATPAMGFVQFPRFIVNGDGSNYVHTDAVPGTINSKSVPMLYVATRGANDTALYAVDVDGGTDDQRLVYRQLSPDGSIFQSSPALIANTSTAGGNGGAVYAVSDNTLYDFSATPISNPGIIDPATGQAQTFPLIRENKAYTGFGPLSSPAVSAAVTTDLLTAAEQTLFLQQNPSFPANADTTADWIYVGDSSTGFCRGITPYDTTDAGIAGELGAIVPPAADAPGAVDLQAIMQVYLVNSNNSGSTNATTSALPINGDLPVYDWGQDVYIRFKNVAPPRDPKIAVDRVVVDPNAPTNGGPIQAYGDGGPIEFDISDSTDGTPPDHGTVPAIFLPAANTPLGNGFIGRSDTDPAPSATVPDSLIDPTTNKGYIGAYTYAISDGTARRNTPGSRRHVLNAKQTVHIYTSTNGTTFTETAQTAVLQVQTTNGNLVSTPTGGNPPSYNLTIVPPVDQPTFGILNPLAVRAGGIPYQLNPGMTPTNAVEIGDPLGPFRGIASPITASPADLEALANGNAILITPPKSTSGGGGGVGNDPTRRNLALTNPPTTTHVVVTSTGLIAHNNTGDNSDAPASGSSLPGLPPQGTTNASYPEGLPVGSVFGSALAPYAMDLADRSALGPRQKRLRVKTGTISGGGAGLYWNDNSVPTVGHDHDSVVNFLPWEAPPVGYKVGANPSLDYPDIGPSDVSATMFRFSGGTADLTLGNAIAEPAIINGNDPIANRVVRANPIDFHVSIPHFQPANQQVYQRPGTATGYADGFETAPVDVSGNPIITAPLVFPMGYVTTRRIYIPDQTGFYRPGAAFRDVRVYTGVPPDYSTKMGDSTVALPQPVPSGFGIQTSHYAPLTGGNPPASPLAAFDMFNPAFVSQAASSVEDYFRFLTIYNTGNVNLLNVHMDQKQRLNTNTAYALSLVSDALDGTSYIPGYDSGGALTGARSGVFGTNGVLEDYFLVRSSLDTDLVAAYGHNPFIQNPSNTNAAGVPLIQVYPGATFHKAQVGSGNPSTLSVPDSPEGFTPGASLDVSPNLKPVVPNYNTGPVYKALPYVSAAIPFGTPVGSYHGLIQIFEGVDPIGYSMAAAGTDPDSVKQGPFASQGPFAGLTTQIFPPRYGNATGGIGAPSTNPFDTFQIAQAGVNAAGLPNPSVGLMPSSANATTLNASVVEDRMTDGATFGATAMVDAAPGGRDINKNPISTPDFAPAAFRDPASGGGNLSVFWTSGRGGPSYGIYSATVPTLGGAFMPVDPASPGSAAAPNYVNEWWTSLGNATTGYSAGLLQPALPTNLGTNSGLTIAQDALNLGTVGAFAVNVQAPPLTASYQNTLLYYPVTASNGALGSAVPITNDPAQVKYGVKGLFTNTAFSSAPNLWAFWTATTRGRTAIYYNSQDPTSKAWVPASGSNTPSTLGVLPIPAGLSAVADPAPMLMFGNVLTTNGYQGEETIEVTYSGTAPDGKVNLYQSRYQPDGTPGHPKPYQLDLLPYPAVTEILTQMGQTGGWYQARDVAWSRTSQLNLSVGGTPVLYNAANQPLFSRAVFDKATGLLVLTGVPSTISGTTLFTLPAGAPTTTTVTVYLDLATGRARFSLTPNAQVRAFFSPLARRITNGSRADTGPTTFLDGNYKANAADPFFGNIKADRRWYVWRKSGAGGASPSASVYYKTQRLTLLLPSPIGLSIPPAGSPPKLLLALVTVNGTDVTKYVDVDYTRGRIYFPIDANGTYPEGMQATVTYTPANTVTTGTPNGTQAQPVTDTVQWEDEEHAVGVVPPADTASGLNSVTDILLPIATIVNENNVAAFLDPAAYSNTATSVFNPHKVWLFWNSTRNGTADLYYETINPLFAAGP